MKKILVTTLQLAVTVFALWWIFRKPGTFTGMVNAVRQADLIWLLFALLAGAISPIAATLRWWILLRVQSVFLPLKRVSEFYMVGAFFNLFLLGSTGGDAVKAFYVLRESPPERRAGAILAVIMDRLLGLLALIGLAAVFISLRYSWLTRTHEAAQLVHRLHARARRRAGWAGHPVHHRAVQSGQSPARRVPGPREVPRTRRRHPDLHPRVADHAGLHLHFASSATARFSSRTTAPRGRCAPPCRSWT